MFTLIILKTNNIHYIKRYNKIMYTIIKIYNNHT